MPKQNEPSKWAAQAVEDLMCDNDGQPSPDDVAMLIDKAWLAGRDAALEVAKSIGERRIIDAISKLSPDGGGE